MDPIGFGRADLGRRRLGHESVQRETCGLDRHIPRRSMCF